MDLTATLWRNLITITCEVVLLLLLGWLLSALAGRLIRWLSSVIPGEKLQQSLRQVAGRSRLSILLLFAGLGLVLGVLDGYLTYQGNDILETRIELLAGIPPGFWRSAAVALLKVIGLVIAATVVLRLLRVGLGHLSRWTQNIDNISANDESIASAFTTLQKVVARAGWLWVASLAAPILGLPQLVSDTLQVILRIYLIAAIGLLCWRALDAVIETLDAHARRYSEARDLQRYYEHLRALVPVARRSLEYIIYLLVGSLIALQIEPTEGLAEIGMHLIRVIGFVFLARLLVSVVNVVIDEVMIRRPQLTDDQLKSRQTMTPLVQHLLSIVIYSCCGMFVLMEFGIDPIPVLAGAGIVGLAVGLGAQNLISDLIAGFSILLEGFYLVGDFVEIGDAEGIVESITLDTTRIRDRDGRLHIIRNGQIERAVNYSKEYTYAVVEVGVAYDSDIDHVLEVLRETGRQLAESRGDVLEPTEVEGLEAFGESELLIRTVTKVRPGCHMEEARQLRRLIKIAFDRHAIEIPFARRVVILQHQDAEPEATRRRR